LISTEPAERVKWAAKRIRSNGSMLPGNALCSELVGLPGRHQEFRRRIRQSSRQSNLKES
jgi:hypothetical protein